MPDMQPSSKQLKRTFFFYLQPLVFFLETKGPFTLCTQLAHKSFIFWFDFKITVPAEEYYRNIYKLINFKKNIYKRKPCWFDNSLRWLQSYRGLTANYCSNPWVVKGFWHMHRIGCQGYFECIVYHFRRSVRGP